MVKNNNQLYAMSLSKPNRAARRAMQRQRIKEIKQEMKKHNPHDTVVLISCPDCRSTDVIDSTTQKDYFKCNNCGSEHPLSEMDVNL